MDHSAIINARRHFESVLEDVIVTANSQGSDDGSTRGDQQLMVSGSSRTPDASQTSKRAVGKSPGRKRPRNREESKVPAEETNVMTLFDRSVDLAQFNMESPLYVICRAWMRNLRPAEPVCDTGGMVKLSPAAEEISDDSPVFRLPPPAKRMVVNEAVKSESELRAATAKLTANVDEALVQQADEDTSEESEEQIAEQTSSVLSDNVTRWRALREQRCRQMHQDNRRYADSFALLTQLKKSDDS